jgi:hypothetical protein
MTEFPPLEDVEQMFLKALTKPSSRSLQSKLGPSEVGGCPYCIGYTMAAKLCKMPPREADPFGYAAHIGTMCHYYLEHKLDLVYGAGYEIASHRETKLKDIFHVPGYGPISGSSDLFVPDWGRTFDFKFPGKYSYDLVSLAIAKGLQAQKRGEPFEKTHAPSMRYRVQQQIYRKGWENLGHEVGSSVIIFLPRHSNSIKDVLFWEEPNNDQLLEDAMARTGKIWEYVVDGQLDGLPSDLDCYTCDTEGRGNTAIYNQLHSNHIKEHAA